MRLLQRLDHLMHGGRVLVPPTVRSPPCAHKRSVATRDTALPLVDLEESDLPNVERGAWSSTPDASRTHRHARRVAR